MANVKAKFVAYTTVVVIIHYTYTSAVRICG